MVSDDIVAMCVEKNRGIDKGEKCLVADKFERLRCQSIEA